MFERLLDKNNIPDIRIIQATLGMEAMERLDLFEGLLSDLYALKRELKFPFGKNYGWGYKYNHKSKHLCYLFFEQGGFTVFTQIGDKQVPEIEGRLTNLSDRAKEVWLKRYPCGDYGGWISFRVMSKEDVLEALEFVKAKVKPIVIND